jgi:hypothetical protein
MRGLSRKIYARRRPWPADETRLAERYSELQRLRERQAALANALGLDLGSLVRYGSSSEG